MSVGLSSTGTSVRPLLEEQPCITPMADGTDPLGTSVREGRANFDHARYLPLLEGCDD